MNESCTQLSDHELSEGLDFEKAHDERVQDARCDESPSNYLVSSHHFLMAAVSLAPTDIIYRQYKGEPDLAHVMALVQSELSEPYVIYTFRYFLHQWYV